MRARTVNEEVNFERGQDPKESMGIGGINLADEYDEKMYELKYSLDATKEKYDIEWEEYVGEVLRGKTITAEMTKMPTMDKSGAMSGKHERGKFTVKVQDVKPSDEFSKNIGSNVHIMPSIIVADIDNNIYQMKMDQKISFR